MIHRLIEFSLRNRGLIVVFYIGLAFWGYWALLRTPIDAIPDLSDNQVIVFTDWPGRSPQEVEDQVTYPLVTNLQGLAGVRVVRASSAFSFSMINIIFEDRVELYWARTRVLERLNLVTKQLPEGVVPTLGPDATGVGQIFWYTIESDQMNLRDLRSLQDWFVRYQLNSVPGVAEVASVGGYVQQYQVDVDPNKLRAYAIPLSTVVEAVQRSNNNVGGNVVEQAGAWAVVRGVGLIESVADVEKVVIGAPNGVPIYVRNVAEVKLGNTGIGNEFMPPLNEGDLMYMPVTDPAISIDEALKITSKQDAILKSFPEVEWAVGKSGRAETSTDPAPVNMNETIVHLKPPEQWRLGMTREKLVAEMDEKLRMPGVTNIWTQPIINRIDMLTTGIRSQVGIKIFGNDLKALEDASRRIAEVVKTVPGAVDVYPEQISGAPYVDIKINRTAAARYGIDVRMIQDAIEQGIGETNLTVTIEGRRRFPVRVRYAPQFRSNPDALGQLPISSSNGAPIPLAQLAEIRTVEGPSMISSENGLLRGTVLLNVRGRDVGSFVDQAKEAIASQVQLPTGYYVSWSGQYENQQRARQRLMIVIPIVLVVIFGLLYITYHSVLEAAHVLMAVPFALTGGVYLLWLLGYNFSVAVWVGFIALFGTAVQTGVVMVIYLNEAVERKKQEVGTLTRQTLKEAVTEGALLRLRPKVMTVSTVVAGLLPIMWSTSAGSEVMKPLATPVLGGMVSSLLHVLIVTPAIFYSLRARELKREEKELASKEGRKVFIDETARQTPPEGQT